MGRIPTLGAMLFIGTFLSGCATTTYTQYESEVRYGKARANMRQSLLEDDSMPVCFNMPANFIVAKVHTAMLECAAEERSKRPYDLTIIQILTYGNADVECARKDFVIKHMDSIDLNSVPAKYLPRCINYKTYYAEE